MTVESPRIPSNTIQELKEKVDLRMIAGAFTELHGRHEQHGPCPRCGGVDRFHVQASMFFCRQCYPPDANHGRHDVYDFARFIGAAQTFREAFTVVADWANIVPSSVRQEPRREVIQSAEPAEWQTRAQQMVVHNSQLLTSVQGEVGRAYLAQRQIEPETWQRAQLGLASVRDIEGNCGWAIALPWFDGDRVTAIQYRFIQPQDQRYTRFGYQRYYGETTLYTLPPKATNTLVMVEGEFNALSIWQATPYTAVSFGSENMTSQTFAALRQTATAYPTVTAWADKEAVATALLQRLGRTGRIIATTDDANALLQRDALGAVLA